jgi:hypothetical protein
VRIENPIREDTQEAISVFTFLAVEKNLRGSELRKTAT